MEDKERIYHLAINLLARREHSRVELRTKLRTKLADVAPDSIDFVLQELITSNQLSDARFTEAYIRMRSERGYGPSRIHAELLERGVSDAIIEEYLSLHRTQESPVDHIEAVRKKRFGPSMPTDLAEQARQMRFLQYRGFSHELMKQLFRGFCK